MTIFKVPWIPRYVTEVDARLILAASVRQTPVRATIGASMIPVKINGS